MKSALIEAAQKPCRRQCSPRIRSQIVCAQDKDGRNCRKLKECELRELNCRLRSRKQASELTGFFFLSFSLSVMGLIFFLNSLTLPQNKMKTFYENG